MSQHFLLSAVARTLSLSSIFRMTDDEARDTFKRIRWSGNNSEPFCSHCGCLVVYTLAENAAAVEVQRLPAQVLPHVGNALSLPQAGGPRLPRRDRLVRQRREGHVCATDQPRSQH
jgi:hypothetical protein